MDRSIQMEVSFTTAEYVSKKSTPTTSENARATSPALNRLPKDLFFWIFHIFVHPISRNHISGGASKKKHRRFIITKQLRLCVFCTFLELSTVSRTCLFKRLCLCVHRWKQCLYRRVPSNAFLSCSSGRSPVHLVSTLYLHSVLYFRVHSVRLFRHMLHCSSIIQTDAMSRLIQNVLIIRHVFFHQGAHSLSL